MSAAELILDKPADDLAAYKAAVCRMTREECDAEWSRMLGRTADNFRRLAILVQRRISEGWPIRDYLKGCLAFLPRVADGSLDADLMHKLFGEVDKLRVLSGLPLDMQRRVAVGDRFEIAVWRGEEFDKEERRLSDLTSHQLRRVVCGPRLLTLEEQQSRLRTEREKPAKPATAAFDPEKNGGHIGCKLTKAQWASVRLYCQKSKQKFKPPQLVEHLLREAGAID